MAAEESVTLHEVVKDIAARLELKDGRLEMSDGDLARHRARLMRVTAPEEKKDVLVSLVALGSRLMRESREGTSQAVDRLMDLTAGLIGDPVRARALFTQAEPPKKR